MTGCVKTGHVPQIYLLGLHIPIRRSSTLFVIISGLVAYLLLWPVPIEPVAWNTPETAGYSGPFAPNHRLQKLRRINLDGHSGPEDMVVAAEGSLFIPTQKGTIFKYEPQAGTLSEFANTGGHPLGMEFGTTGDLYVADAYKGLLKITPSGAISVLTSSTDSGSAIRFADDVDVTSNGIVFFTDASTKFGARSFGGTLPASLLDLMEHGPNGRVLKFDPTTGRTTTVLAGLSFANGIALTADETHYLVVETGTYSILKVPVQANQPAETILQNLPGFPDNINRNADGTFWIGLASPRSAAMDFLSGRPFLRKVVQRLPAFMRPKPQRYGFVLRIDEAGNVLETLQDPSGAYALTTGLIEGADGTRYITSVTEPDLGVIDSN